MMHKQQKDVSCLNGQSAVDHSTITRWFKKYCFDCKSLDDQSSLGSPKAMLQAIEPNLASNNQRESGDVNF